METISTLLKDYTSSTPVGRVARIWTHTRCSWSSVPSHGILWPLIINLLELEDSYSSTFHLFWLDGRRIWFCSKKPWLKVMPSHNTNASHFGGSLCHFYRTFLPGVVTLIVILWLHCVFWLTKYLHVHVPIKHPHQPWEKMRWGAQLIT